LDTKLVSMTVIILQCLIKEYYSKKIDLNVFSKHAEIKIQFLKEYGRNVPQKNLLLVVEDTIRLCEEIFCSNSKLFAVS
jgi:hypothetical protein